MTPLNFGSVGLGGYAGFICDLLLAESAGENPAIRLTAVCEPDQTTHGQKITSLRDAGIQVFDSYDELLKQDLAALWLPLPIDLHRPFTEKALSAGKSVMCEKPAAGTVDDLDAMAAQQKRTGQRLAFGFQDIYSPLTHDLKRRLLGGDLGQIQSASLYACWPRGSAYYRRASWAGALQRDGHWVLDSPPQNAMAHYLNLALFLLGPTEQHSANPQSVDAELYRINPITNYDTCALRITAADVPLTVLMTHACASEVHPRLVIRGTKGVIRIRAFAGAEVEIGGRTESLNWPQSIHSHMVRSFAAWVRGDDPQIVATTAVARAHLVVINGASEAAPITTISKSAVEEIPQQDGTLRTIRGIEKLFEQCADKNQLLSESGLVPWAARPASRDLRNYTHFAGAKG